MKNFLKWWLVMWLFLTIVFVSVRYYLFLQFNLNEFFYGLIINLFFGAYFAIIPSIFWKIK